MDREYIRNMPMQAPGLAIDAGDHTLLTNANAFVHKIDGRVYKATSGLSFAAMSGITIADGNKAMISVLIDTLGVISYEKGLEVLASQPVVFPSVPQDDLHKAVVGFLLLENATGLVWTGGTDDIDASGMTVDVIDNQGFVGL